MKKTYFVVNKKIGLAIGHHQYIKEAQNTAAEQQQYDVVYWSALNCSLTGENTSLSPYQRLALELINPKFMGGQIGGQIGGQVNKIILTKRQQEAE